MPASNRIKIDLDNGSFALLTKQQIKILEFLESGYKRCDLSELLKISIKSLDAQIGNIYRELDINKDNGLSLRTNLLNTWVGLKITSPPLNRLIKEWIAQ